MLSDEYLSECGKRHGYNYFDIIAECMKLLTETNERSDELRLIRKNVKDRILDMVVSRTPYSHYLPDKYPVDVDFICDQVRADKTMRSERTKLYDQHALHLEYDYLKDKFKEPLERLVNHITTSNRMDVDQKYNMDGYRIYVRLIHYLIFKNDVPSCYICQRKVTKFTLAPATQKFGKVSQKYHTLTAWIDHDGQYVPMTVDHKFARALGGEDWFGNIELACDSCNLKKSVYESKIGHHNASIDAIESNKKLYPFQYRLAQPCSDFHPTQGILCSQKNLFSGLA